MQKELWIKYCNDFGKFLIDGAKIIFGTVFIASFLKTESISGIPLIGLIISVIGLMLGIFLSNLKTK
jgi:hypothetical protein